MFCFENPVELYMEVSGGGVTPTGRCRLGSANKVHDKQYRL